MARTVDPDGSGGAGEIDTFFAGYVGINPTLEFDADDDDDVSHRYLWGAGFDMLLADEQISSVNSAGNTLWPLADHLGTIRDIADYDEGDPQFEITNHRVFDSFGRLESETDSGVDVAFGFTGKYTDEDTLYTQHLFRWYDPRTGRWLTDDPLGFAAGDANLSRYVGNEAVGHVDSMGLFEQGVGYEGPQSDSPALQNDEWWNNDWTDWVNPFAYAAGAGDRVGGVRELPPYDSREGLKISGFAMLMPHANFDGNPVDPNSYLGLRRELGLERVPAGPDEEFYDDVKQIPLLGSGTQFLYGETIRPGETRKGAWRLLGDAAMLPIGGIAKNFGDDVARALDDILAGRPRPNVRKPKPFANDGRGGTTKLPEVDSSGNPITYTEHTVNPRPPGQDLDGKRINFGSDGSIWVTLDHFNNWEKIR